MWGDVKEAANDIFSVWIDQPELQWAKKSWGLIEKYGLTVYENEFERHIVVFRFLILGGIYNDFCCVTWEECFEPEYDGWADIFELEPHIIWQLYANLSDWEPDEDIEERDALVCLVENCRNEVVTALLNGFGNENNLYASLWGSRYPLHSEEIDGDMELIIPGMMEGYDPFLPVTFARMRGYEWVEQGCYSFQ